MEILPVVCKKPVSLEAINDYPDFQVVSPRLVAGRQHLEFAIRQAELARERGEAISNNDFVEIMVRVSAARQIARALSSFGIDETKEVILIFDERPEAFLEDFGCTEAPDLLDLTAKKIEDIKEYFGITEEELEATPLPPERALVEIIKERIALLNA